MFGKRQPALANHEKRRAARSSVNAPAVVQTTAFHLQTTIVNISATGARLIAEDRPPPRQDVLLVVNGIDLFGKIVWRRNNAFGIKFEDDLHDYSPDEILQAVKEASIPIYEFDRDVILANLVNQEPSANAVNEDAVVE